MLIRLFLVGGPQQTPHKTHRELMNAAETYQPEGCIITEGPLGTWFTLLDFIFGLNEVHGDFRRVFFEHFRALATE